MSSIEDNPSFSGDIRLYSHSGLCNRLRLIAEYKHLSDVKNKKIEMFWVKEIKNKNHLIFKPTDDIMENIEGTKERIGEDYIACHIRRADIITIQKKYNVEPPSDEYFEDFMKSHPDRKIYLATDSRRTQDRFIEKFGNRVYYSNIPSGNGSTKRPNRTTPVQEAVADLFLCIGSVDFLGTDCSSFSGFIKNYRKGKNAKT